MDKKTERSGRDKVLRRVAGAVKQLGFSRTKPTFFTRPNEYWVEFGHIHKFTFGPYFRVHFGIRLLDDKSESFALNGPNSDSIVSWSFLTCEHRKYNFEYGNSADSIEKCALDILKFWKKVGIPWFKKWEDPRKLINSRKSPLPNEQKALLAKVVDT